MGVIVEPQDILGAQFSMGYSLALMLYQGGCGFWDFFNADLADPDMLDLSRRVSVILDGDDRGRFATGLVIKMKLRDGTVLEADAAHAHGEPEWPLTDGEIRDKFLNIAGPGARCRGHENMAESNRDIAEQPRCRTSRGCWRSEAIDPSWPRVGNRRQTMREGMQIESATSRSTTRCACSMPCR